MFSKACEYAIKAIIYIATQSLEGKRVKIADIVENSACPEAFTAKVLGTLTKHNIVNSHTGPSGGFEIELSKMKKTKLSDIVYSIDGNTNYSGCVLGLNECNSAHPCPIHDKFIDIRNSTKKALETTTIYDLATGLKSGKTVLIR